MLFLDCRSRREGQAGEERVSVLRRIKPHFEYGVLTSEDFRHSSNPVLMSCPDNEEL